MFKDILYSMLNDMSKYHRDKDDLLAYYINKRLNKSLQVYYKELSKSIEYLSSKSELKVLKNMK